jgi:hypothetical protein
MSSILKPKTSSSHVALRVRIPAALASEIEQVRQQAGAAGLVFDVSAVCSVALAQAVKQARREISALAAPQEGRGAEREARHEA